jgi:hypothetical protein
MSTEEQGSSNILDGPVSVSISRPCWYYYPSSRPFGPTALQGHASVDVFSCGLIYVTLLDQIPAFEVLVVFVLYGVAIPHLVDDALPKEVVLPLLLSPFVFPLLSTSCYKDLAESSLSCRISRSCPEISVAAS